MDALPVVFHCDTIHRIKQQIIVPDFPSCHPVISAVLFVPGRHLSDLLVYKNRCQVNNQHMVFPDCCTEIKFYSWHFFKCYSYLRLRHLSAKRHSASTIKLQSKALARMNHSLTHHLLSYHSVILSPNVQTQHCCLQPESLIRTICSCLIYGYVKIVIALMYFFFSLPFSHVVSSNGSSLSYQGKRTLSFGP